MSATSNRNSSISGSTKALIHSPEVKAPHVMQVSESPDSLTNDKPNEETAAVGNDNTTVEKTDRTNLSSADQQHSMNRKSEYKDDSLPLPDHETSKQSSDALQNTRDKPSSKTSNLSKNVSYAGSEFSLGNTKSPPMARNLSVASILSRTSQTSYASNMGLNEVSLIKYQKSPDTVTWLLFYEIIFCLIQFSYSQISFTWTLTIKKYFVRTSNKGIKPVIPLSSL